MPLPMLTHPCSGLSYLIKSHSFYIIYDSLQQKRFKTPMQFSLKNKTSYTIESHLLR